jgi:hypothetical protein
MIQMASLVLGVVMVVIVAVAWQMLGVALEDHERLSRVYRTLTALLMALVLTAAILFFFYGGGREMLADLF